MGAAAALSIAALAAVHLLGSRLRVSDLVPRDRWLSAAGGASVAYVFLHIFPELAAAQRALAERAPGPSFLEHHAYLVALGGLTVFYGLEHYARTSPGPATLAFRVHMGAFALYNAVVGALVAEWAQRGLAALVLFACAMGLHFFVNDHSLRERHQERYLRTGRWLLAGSVAAGGIVQALGGVPQTAVHALFAVVAGATILNVLKEELPEERGSRFPAFLLGAVLYGAVLLAAGAA